MKGPLLPSVLQTLTLDCVQRLSKLPFIGQPVGLILHNTPHSVALLLAAQRLNLHAVLLAPSRLPELQKMAQAHTGITLTIENTPAALSLQDLGQQASPPLPTHPYWCHHRLQQGSACLFTSGSTGESKVVAYSWEALLTQARETLKRCSYLTPSRPADSPNPEPPWQLVAASPIAHAYAINAVFTCHLGSVPLGLPVHTELASYFQETSDYQTAILGTPVFYRALLELVQDPKTLRQVRYPYSAGCSLTLDTWTKFREKFGIRLLQNFGTSETGNIAVFESPLDGYTEGYVGKPWGEVKFRPVEAGERETIGGQQFDGEILVSVPWMSQGYVSQGALRPHPEFHPTGDFGRLSLHEGSEGLLVGPRLRPRMVLAAGFDFSPLEAEEVLKAHGGVQECVFVQGDQHLGVFVTPKSEGITEAALKAWWDQQRGDRFPAVSRVKICQELPKSPAGKIIYRLLTWDHL